ncbi:uncharacterized protein BDFB_008851 [Asbolus verrucosus]|uniref:Ricin B lectin domain-containing protein n=1 Tax=Asbolus verrucosus TaxID=1661398 RepID=A0A482W2G7_ASBVE|nr:uncharacterized protein BDFB_008851 [Asbolus verrucosus]
MQRCLPDEHHHHRGKHAVIRNPHSGLVLDAGDDQVKLQHFTGFAAQLWSVEPTDEGKFFIRNKANGKVLDIQGGSKRGHNIITFEKHGGENQQWHLNSDDTIVNVCDNLALDIYKDRYHAGNHLVAWTKHGKPNQHFYFQYQ